MSPVSGFLKSAVVRGRPAAWGARRRAFYQNAARAKAGKLVADYPAVEHVRIVFDEEGHKYVVSLAVQGGQKTTVGATAKDADATAALNAVFDKANAQLRRASKKRQEVRK